MTGSENCNETVFGPVILALVTSGVAAYAASVLAKSPPLKTTVIIKMRRREFVLSLFSDEIIYCD